MVVTQSSLHAIACHISSLFNLRLIFYLSKPENKKCAILEIYEVSYGTPGSVIVNSSF